MADINMYEESRILYLARALYDAVEDSNIQQVNILLSQNKANPNMFIPEEGMTTFHLAAGHENIAFGKIVCRLFLHNRGDPNVRCEGNRTVHHIAVAWNHYIFLETLLKSPYIVPDLFIKDEDGLDVFNYAIKYSAWESLAILQSAIKHSKSISLNHQICNTIQTKYIVKDDSSLTKNGKTIKSICSNSTLNESDILHTNSGYINSGESLNDTPVSIKNNLDTTTINDILNKNISSNNIYNSLIEDISSFDGSIMNSITPNFELTDDNIFDPLSRLHLNDTKWMTNVSECSSCEEYFTCPETNSKQQIVNNKTDKDDIHNLSKISVHNLTRSISKMSMEINNLEMISHYKSSSEESNLTEMSNEYDTDYLKHNLKKYGIHPGPIVGTTKELYVRKLNKIKKNHSELNYDDKHDISLEYSYSIQLIEVLNNDQCNTWKKLLKTWSALEEDIILNHNGSSFTYLLLDPRITKNLPARVDLINNSIEIWQTFINSIFYIGKGTNSRPYAHIREAFNSWFTKSNKNFNPKTKYILNLWKENMGVVCVQAFHNLMQKEANIREAAMIEAIGLNKLTNKKHGTYYYKSKHWGKNERCKLGCYLLYRAMNVFLADGERQLQPKDLT